jgi:hypothetical protein
MSVDVTRHERLPERLRTLPPGVRRAANGALRGAAVATSRLRSLPDFVIVGAKRGGTTTLFRTLERHPEVASLVPAFARIKSPHYFDLNYARGDAWYRSHFALRPDRLRGESNPYLLFHPLGPERVAAIVPDTKLIALLRDPVERAFSHYWDRVKNGVETLSFADAVAAEADRLAGQRERLEASADRGVVSEAHEHYSYLARGLYAEQLRRWLAHYPAERLLVLRSEDLYREPHATYDRVTAFLGLSQFDPGVFEKHHGHADRPRIDPGLRRELAATFSRPNEELAELLGTPVWWDADGATGA